VIRDPDGFIYYKEEVGGLVMGGFEPVAKPWNVDPIPDRFEFQLLAEDWDHFEVLDDECDPSDAVSRNSNKSNCC
jgi:4-methylaminobutanoate oxidase (formaldehyde-forming)